MDTFLLFAKIISIVVMIFSDFMFVFAGMKYVATHGDPKAVENAKIQIMFSGMGIIISTIILIALHIYEGIDFALYTTVEWVCFYIFLSMVGLFLLSMPSFMLDKPIEKLTKRWKKFFENFFFALPILSFILGGLSFQLFLILISF